MAMFGSIAGAESVLLAFDEDCTTTVAMVEAPHGTAPTLTGRDVANPMAMVSSAATVLHHAAAAGYAGYERAARATCESVPEASADGVRTPDLGGETGTAASTADVVRRVKTQIEPWSSLGTTI